MEIKHFKHFETLLKYYYVTGADFKRFVTFWKRLSSDSVGSSSNIGLSYVTKDQIGSEQENSD